LFLLSNVWLIQTLALSYILTLQEVFKRHRETKRFVFGQKIQPKNLNQSSKEQTVQKLPLNIIMKLDSQPVPFGKLLVFVLTVVCMSTSSRQWCHCFTSTTTFGTTITTGTAPTRTKTIPFTRCRNTPTKTTTTTTTTTTTLQQRSGSNNYDPFGVRSDNNIMDTTMNVVVPVPSQSCRTTPSRRNMLHRVLSTGMMTIATTIVAAASSSTGHHDVANASGGATAGRYTYVTNMI
jgi:hypothetical protein